MGSLSVRAIRFLTCCIVSWITLGPGTFMNAHAQMPADSTVLETVYLVVFRPGPAWIEGKPTAEQPLLEHGRYWLAHYAAERMIEAGPFTDDSGGAVVLRAADLATAEAMVAQDPAVVSGVLVGTVYPWLLRNWEYYLSRMRSRQ